MIIDNCWTMRDWPRWAEKVTGNTEKLFLMCFNYTERHSQLMRPSLILLFTYYILLVTLMMPG